MPAPRLPSTPRTGTTFYFRYTDARGRAREIKLGRAPDVTVEQARRRAEQLKAQVSLGADPAAERARARAVPTLAEFARDRYLPHVREHLRSAGNIDAYLRLRVLPFLGARALDEVTQADVAALRRRLIDGYVQAVSRAMGVDPDAPVSLNNQATAAAMISAMARRETGRSLDPAVVNRGVGLALAPAAPAAQGAPMQLASASGSGSDGNSQSTVRVEFGGKLPTGLNMQVQNPNKVDVGGPLVTQPPLLGAMP